MGDFKKQICRLCLGVIPAGMGEIIEETNKEKLEVLLISINFDISDNAIACNRCLENLQDCFDFKSNCSFMDNSIASCMNVDLNVDIKTVFEEEMSKESVNLENVQVCRLCMSPIKDGSFNCPTDLKDDFFLKDMPRNYLPKMDLNTDHVPLICNRCQTSAKKYGEFIKTCHDVEEKIKNYCQVAEGYAITSRVILEDVLEFKNCGTLSNPIVIKNECLDVENDDMTEMERLKGENTASVKCEEIDIKDEFDIEVETSESVQSGNCNNSEMNGSSKRKRCIKAEKKQRSNSSQQVQECYLCSFVTDTRSLLNAHVMSHKGSTKLLRCHQCSYETNSKHCLKMHFLKHKDKSEVEMHKCPLCPYKSKYKSSMIQHRKLKHDQNTKVYNCKDCSYITKNKSNLMSHQLMHKNPEEIPSHKCEKCEFETKYKHNLTLHMRVHEDSAKFKCEKCPYQCKRQGDIKRHMMTHSRSENLYSCEQCSYYSPSLANLRRHMRVHQTDCKETTMRCDQCDFHTKHKRSLWRHKLWHDPTRPTLKCDKCEYYTKETVMLKNHQVKHMKLGDTKVYYCLTCNFKTKYRCGLLSHMIRAQKCLMTKR